MAKIKIALKDSWVTWETVGFGITGFFCFCREYSAPVGVVWTACSGCDARPRTRVEVIDSHVIQWARRQGVRSRINEAIFAEYGADVIMTHEGTAKGGLAFLKHWRYQRDGVSGTWALSKRRWQQRRRELKRRR